MEVRHETIYPPTPHGGRPGNPIVYSHVPYNGNEYTVIKVKFNNEYVYGLIDKDDFPKIKEHTWHYTSNAYLSHNIKVDEKQKALYLHNVVMGRLDHTGKGSTETVDHINRNGLDNRKENLRLLTQTAQNLNQKRKGRHVEFPEDSPIKAEDLPKHVWFIKANGSHGDRFGIDLKTEGIQWKTTSSTKVSLQDKLHAAKEKLRELYKLYPYLNPENDETTFMAEGLAHSYEEIIRLCA
jgi:hypothetical protein